MTTMTNRPDLWSQHFPWPSEGAHKHQRGRMIVVSGPMSRTGAARLAARAGLRIGAGVVTVLSPPGALMVHAVNLEAVMVRPFSAPEDLAAKAVGSTAAVIGPAAGVGEATCANLAALGEAGCPRVVDADALTSFSGRVEALAASLTLDDIVTPHEGEFERLFPGLLNAGRSDAIRRASEALGAHVLLKGRETLIAEPQGRLSTNPNGAPWLATAGSGDVLAGMVGGLLAQGMPTFEAACAATWLHAEAAHAFGPGLIAEDLPGLLPRQLAYLYEKGRTP